MHTSLRLTLRFTSIRDNLIVKRGVGDSTRRGRSVTVAVVCAWANEALELLSSSKQNLYPPNLAEQLRGGDHLQDTGDGKFNIKMLGGPT